MKKFCIDSWMDDFKEKEIEPDNLNKIIKPGYRVFLGSGCSEPVILTEQLTKNYRNWADCEIFHYFTISNQQFFRENAPADYRHNTLSIIGSPKMREAINQGKADYTTISGSDIPQLLRGIGQRLYIDVALIQVSPPDRFGNCSLGINVDLNKTIVSVAKIIVAHINPQMPRTMGDSFIKFQDIDYFVYKDMPLLEYNPNNFDQDAEDEDNEERQQTRKIAQYCAQLIDNGSTINFGAGRIPYTIPEFLTNKKDLAFYSELLPESVMDLIEHENAPVNCSKNYYPHIMTTMAMGTRKFYDYIDNNPFIELHSTEYLSNVLRIAKNTKLCSIYGATFVDVIGQVTNHKPGLLHSGMGSEADFMKGASLTEGGKCIIALRSITKEGESAIKPILTTEPLCLCAYQVHYIVTEYGIAYLHGKTARERILQMIGIAHPKFRKDLLEEAKRYNMVYEDQQIPVNKDGVVVIYPDIRWQFETRNKGTVNFRPVKPTDERLVQDLYYRLSPEDRVKRFFISKESFPHRQTQSLISVDYQNSMYIIGFIGDEQNKRIIAVGMYKLEEDTGLAELALTIDGEYQKQGLGRHILMKLAELAQERGIRGMCGDFVNNNVGMHHLLETIPYKVTFRAGGQSTEFYFQFKDKKVNKTKLKE